MNELLQAVVDDPWGAVADTLPKVRSWAGPLIADHLSETPPEDRTWTEGAIVAVLSLTDKGDGLAARRSRKGPTEHGQELDRDADVNFVTSQQKSLTANGEVSPTHILIKEAREIAMDELRDWGARNGKSTASLWRGKQKTTVEMTTLSAANSPLAQRGDLIRWGASLGTALELTSFAETVFDYMKKDDKGDEPATARNSRARELSAGRLNKLAELVAKKAPNLRASDVTYAGKRLVEGSSALAFLRPDNPVLPTAIYIVGSVCDALDGALARARGEDGIDGEIEDLEADLEQQVAALTALGAIALKRGNMVAATNYAVAIMTTAVVSSSRAEAESSGFIVAEGGIGTRLGRGITIGIGMGLNRHQDAADIASATLASGNVNTIKERRHAARYGEESPHCKAINMDADFMARAARRREAALPYVQAGLAIGSALLAYSAPQMVARTAGAEASL